MIAPDREETRKRGSSLRDGLGYVVMAGAVWLAWEVIKAPLAARTAPELAVRLAPSSPEVLRRAAEAELVAGRVENAQALSSESLARAPFNASALRVRGLAEARLGETDRAREMLTLAGNWSLRDDPAHAWLIQNRLQRGDYGSAFAHADTLARRRPDLYPSLFRLFTAAVVQDPRAFPVITRLLSVNPPWRTAFLSHLHQDPQAAPALGGLAIALEKTDAPFTQGELLQLYGNWLVARRIEGIRELRRRLGRPPAEELLQNGDFSEPVDRQVYPFGWTLVAGPGISSTVVEDDLDPENQALRLEYDGFTPGVLVQQLMLLDPGPYVLRARWRTEAPQADARLEWTVTCAESGGAVGLAAAAGLGPAEPEWRTLSIPFSIPAQGCGAQWLNLQGDPGERRTSLALWIDDVEIRPDRAPER